MVRYERTLHTYNDMIIFWLIGIEVCVFDEPRFFLPVVARMTSAGEGVINILLGWRSGNKNLVTLHKRQIKAGFWSPILN